MSGFVIRALANELELNDHTSETIWLFTIDPWCPSMVIKTISSLAAAQPYMALLSAPLEGSTSGPKPG